MHNFINLNAKHNNFTKGVFLDSFDEPTYLTFALDFRFDDASPTSLIDELNLKNSPLFNSLGSASAINFLTNRGYLAQADGLATFREILRHLTFNAPWYFQSIQGLSDLYEVNTDMSKGWKASKDKGKLEIKTLEAVDLRISELAGLYRNAIFDAKHRRERVPDNLRWFSVDVYIAEFRNLRFRLPGETQGIANALGVDTGSIGNIVGGGNILSNVMDEYGFIKFTCRQCEFDFSESLPGSNRYDIGGDGRSPDENRFAIKVGWFEEEAKFGSGTKIYEDPEKTSIRNPWGLRNMANKVENTVNFLSGLPIIGDDIQKAGQKISNSLSKIGGFVNPALQAASKFIEPPIDSLGDAYTVNKTGNSEEYSGTSVQSNNVIEGMYTNDNPVAVIGRSVQSNDAIEDRYFKDKNDNSEEYSGTSVQSNDIIEDKYNIGYESNDDDLPPKQNPPNENVYNI